MDAAALALVAALATVLRAVDGRLQAQGAAADDAGRLPIVVAVLAIFAALTVPEYTPAVAGAMVAGIVTFFVGVWVAMEGRRHLRIRYVNLCVSFLALVVAVALGGHFVDPGLVFMIHNAL